MVLVIKEHIEPAHADFNGASVSCSQNIFLGTTSYKGSIKIGVCGFPLFPC